MFVFPKWCEGVNQLWICSQVLHIFLFVDIMTLQCNMKPLQCDEAMYIVGDQREIKLYENAEEAMGQDYQAVASVSAIAR